MLHRDEPINIAPEMNNLMDRLKQEEKVLALSKQSSLNTLIYYFERFLDQHRQYEKTKNDILTLDSKMEKLTEGACDEDF